MREQPVTGACRSWRWEAISREQLAAVAAAPLPGRVPAVATRRELHRDVFLDTAERSLRARGVRCRLRCTAEGTATLTLWTAGESGTEQRVSVRVDSTEPSEALAQRTIVRRRLAGLVDPAALQPWIALEVERVSRFAGRDWLGRPLVVVHYDDITVRRDSAARSFQLVTEHHLRGSAELAERIAADHGARLRPAPAPLQRAELLMKWLPMAGSGGDSAHSGAMSTGEAGADPAFLDPELSFLESQQRVLSLAESSELPLAERLRFLGIVAANLDEFFMVRVAGLKAALPELTEESAVATDRIAQLEAIATAVRGLQQRQQGAAQRCLAALGVHGVIVRRWNELHPHAAAALRDRYREEIHPALTPLAMTMSPGHPPPRLPSLSRSIAAVLRDRRGGASHFAQIDVPADLPPFLDVEGSAAGEVVPLAEVIRGNLDLLYPADVIEEAWLVRVTRGSLVAIDDMSAADLLEAVDAATRRADPDPIVRVQTEPGMPQFLRQLLVEELGRERVQERAPLEPRDLYELDGAFDFTELAALPLPDDPTLHEPPWTPTVPVAREVPLFETIAAGDLLVHHPFESFADTVVRLLREAADDPAVVVIRMTLYRTGEHSPVIEALRRAARRGKQVYAFVELRARFDEARNVRWVRELEKAGVHVVYGLVGLKTHAKAALIVRREGDRLRRYAHIGSGNYNARTGLAYTDLSLFTADPQITSDVADLFNGLTGSSAPAVQPGSGMLVAPSCMLAPLLAMIEQEAAHARAGRPAWIRIKVNGLSDPDIVRALQRAAADGVAVDLIVRGICTLRIPETTPGLRVVATVGPFLEHSRIYAFANAGAPRYYIGSADLRTRNLRRRIELLVPVRDPAACRRLDDLLTRYLEDPRGWELQPDGHYRWRAGPGPGAQQALLAAVREGGPANVNWHHGLSAAAH